MPWARLDDRFHDNRKVRRVWRRCPEAIALHIFAITYSACHELDGHVDTDWVEDTIPNDRRRQKLTDALVDAQLWHVNGTGWEINDYLEYNPSHADLEAKRETRRAAGHAGASARWGNGNHDG